ncbi:MAG: rod shape-determining protein MreC [Methylophilus sp.]|nr:rod shape-determining protein MreC [Methylophilus sp.]
MLKGVHQKLEPQESPAFFVRGPSPFSRMMFFCALSIVLMAVDSRLNYLAQFRQTFIAALHPLELIAQAPSDWGMNIRHYFTAHGRLLDENQALKQEAVQHKVLLQRLQTIELENAHLRTLLQGNAPIIPKAILGEILHMGRDPFSNVIVVNRGTHHDVKAGQAVVDAEGVIGQVTRAFPFSAEVTLITDDNLAIPIQVERNQLRAIAFGEGKSNTIDLPFLPTSVDIKVGDRLVTSGIDGVYPAGLAVATVTEVRQSPDSPFAKIVSTPIAGVNNHLQLLILSLPEPQQSAMPTEATQVTAETAKVAPTTSPSPTAKPSIENKPNASR